MSQLRTAAHGHGDLGRGWHGGVVDAIADHRHDRALPLQLPQSIRLS
ncbi:MAG: hypothetical protein R3F37_17070 [Candidatus Competibacteraceae bacterium]